MVGRRLLSVLAVLGVVLLAGALPAQAGESGAHQANHHGNHHGDHHGDGHGDGRPSYPPKPPSISITKTTVMVGGTAVVQVTGCQPKGTATVLVVGTSTVSKQVKVGGSGQFSTPIKFTMLGHEHGLRHLRHGLAGTVRESYTGRWRQRGPAGGTTSTGAGTSRRPS